MSLPSGYKRLEYIESSGTQYIDTGFKPNQDTRVVMDAQMLATGTQFLFGARGGSSESYNKSFALLLNATGKFRSDFNGSNVVFDSVTSTDRWTIDKNKNLCQIGGVSLTSTASTFQSSYNAFLFAICEGGAAAYFAKMRTSGSQIYDNGALIRDFIPCQTSSGEVGLWDDVNAKFYGNAGTGSFIAGPVVPEVPAEDPGFFTSLGVTMEAVVLAWGAVNPGQSFRLYRNGALVYEGTDTHYTDHGLIPDVAYSYRITGYNGSLESAGLSLDIRTRDAMWLITDRTDRDTGDKGHYNCLDLIRVNEALDYVADLLRGAGYIVSVNTRKDWSMNDVPTPAEMTAYIQSIQNIKNTMEYLSTTPQPPSTMQRLTWQQANDIEQLLVDAEYTIFHIHNGLKRLAQFDAWCGPGPRFATANHDDGRTWEELDALESTWANWQAANWYLLLYGNLKAEREVG